MSKPKIKSQELTRGQYRNKIDGNVLIVAAGTLNSDQARDLDLPLKDRFFLQPQSPEMAVARAKESAKDIINVKESIEKKAWPFVRDDLRLKAEYLRYDLKTIISAKPKEEKQALKDLTGKLFQDINNVSIPKFSIDSITRLFYCF